MVDGPARVRESFVPGVAWDSPFNQTFELIVRRLRNVGAVGFTFAAPRMMTSRFVKTFSGVLVPTRPPLSMVTSPIELLRALRYTVPAPPALAPAPPRAEMAPWK